jgi:hypothetical protein
MHTVTLPLDCSLWHEVYMTIYWHDTNPKPMRILQLPSIIQLKLRDAMYLLSGTSSYLTRQRHRPWVAD